MLTIPADYTVECSDEIVLDEASATDNCGEIVIELVEIVTPGNATATTSRARSPTDDAGNGDADPGHHRRGHDITRLLTICGHHHRVFCHLRTC